VQYEVQEEQQDEEKAEMQEENEGDAEARKEGEPFYPDPQTQELIQELQKKQVNLN